MRKIRILAERVGFEPTVEFPLHTLSKRAPSTTRTSLRPGNQRVADGRNTLSQKSPQTSLTTFGGIHEPSIASGFALAADAQRAGVAGAGSQFVPCPSLTIL